MTKEQIIEVATARQSAGPLNTGAVPELIWDLIIELANLSGGADPLFPAGTKVYCALLTQTGTSAPVGTVLANTLGVVPTYEYSGEPGIYFCHLLSAMSHGKVFVMGQTSGDFYNHESGIFGLVSFILGEAPFDYVAIKTAKIDLSSGQVLLEDNLLGGGNEKSMLLILVFP